MVAADNMFELFDEGRVAVPGFGFLPHKVVADSDKLFQVRMIYYSQQKSSSLFIFSAY